MHFPKTPPNRLEKELALASPGGSKPVKLLLTIFPGDSTTVVFLYIFKKVSELLFLEKQIL